MVPTSHSTCGILGGVPRCVSCPLAIYNCSSGFHCIPKVPRSLLPVLAFLSPLPPKPHAVTGKCVQNTDTACCGLELSLIWPGSLSMRGSWRRVWWRATSLQGLLQQVLSENFSIKRLNKSIKEEPQYTRLCVYFKRFKLHICIYV